MPAFLVVHESGGTIRTSGLVSHGYLEIVLRGLGDELLHAGEEMLKTLGNYQIDNNSSIRPGNKVSHGYWVLQLKSESDTTLEVWESSADGSTYVPGAALTLRYWIDQHKVCEAAGAKFSPPNPEQKAAVSAGTLEGALPLEAVRYAAPSHMSGWYLTTEEYSGNVEDLHVEHLFHVTAARPAIAKYLALPVGFRFRVGETEDTVFFDQTVLHA